MSEHKSIRRIVSISQNLNGIYQFTKQISSVPFTPDHIIVRTVTLYTEAAQLGFNVYSDLIQDNLFSIAAGANAAMCVTPNTVFRCTNGNGNWNFSLRDTTGAVIAPPGAAVHLFFQLEFVKN